MAGGSRATDGPRPARQEPGGPWVLLLTLGQRVTRNVLPTVRALVVALPL